MKPSLAKEFIALSGILTFLCAVAFLSIRPSERLTARLLNTSLVEIDLVDSGASPATPDRNTELIFPVRNSTTQSARVRLRPGPLLSWGNIPMRTLGVAFVALCSFSLSALVLILAALYMRRKSREAQEVIRALEAGNLSARFPLNRLDETGHLMQDFNRMADTVESLVLQLKKAQAARGKLITELGHDVRTPLTSLRYLLDWLGESGATAKKAALKERVELASSELTYFERLIEDLFLLSELDSAAHSLASVDVLPLLREAVTGVQARALRENPGIQIELEIPENGFWVKADPYLAKRLFENALGNAARYAKSRVTVSLSISENRLELRVLNDGEGFPEHVLKSFGEKRSSRFMDTSDGRASRASLGLGSVIMKSIAERLNGSVEPSNLKARGKTAGASLMVTLPGQAAARFAKAA